MEFKLRKYKRENILMIILVGAFACFVISLLLTFPAKKNNSEVGQTKQDIEMQLTFNGIKKSEITFDKTYANYVYDNNGKIESHFVDLKNKKEITLDDLIKNDMHESFYNKIQELLNVKYTGDIAKTLNDTCEKIYVFTVDNLNISYTCQKQTLDNETYLLEVKYNNINEYLKFNLNIQDEPAQEEFVEIPIKEETDKENIIQEQPIQNNENKVNIQGNISVAFTFDDGPSGNRTVRLVNELEKRNMSATFFMVGYKLNGDKETVKHVYNSNSEIGYHSWNHSYFTKQNKETIIEEFNKTNNIINEITGGHLYLTRPPYGSYNNTTLEALPTPLIRWNLDTNDWRYRDVEYIKNYVLENISDGSIILFHDTYDTTVEAAIWLMEELKNRGVEIMSVSRLAQLKGIVLEKNNAYYSFKK